MSIKQRLIKLESSINPEATVIHIKRFVVDCGSADPIGYECGSTEIMRSPDESQDELKARCHSAVAWPAGTSRHTFHPIYAD